MFQQQGLDLGGSDAEAFILDHLFLAVDDVGITIGIDMSDITGVEPAVAQGARGLLGRFPVALHYLWPANDQFAVFSDRQFALAGLDVHELLFRVMGGHTYALHAYEIPVLWLRVCEWRCLGQAVALHYEDAGLVLEPACRFRRHGRGSRENVLDRSELAEVQGSICQCQNDRWHSKIVGDVMFFA